MLDVDNDDIIIDQEDYIEWMIHDWNKINIDNKIIKSPNFRIGNSIWYVI